MSYTLDDVMNRLDDIEGRLNMVIEAVLPGVMPERVPYPVHPVAPAPDAVVFGADSRELPHGVPAGEIDYPLLSTCMCGRQIARIAIRHGWEYCGS